ncbi:MAG: hypothetical protein ACLGGV_07180 [Bacteroidia bacterium]
MKNCLAILSVFVSGLFSAQNDTVYFMSGKNISMNVDSISNGMVYGFSNEKFKKISSDAVYGYSLNGSMSYVYPDRSIDFLSVPQMKEFIYGKQIARKKYSITAQVITGFTLGLLGSMYDMYESDTIFNKAPQFSKERFYARSPSYGVFIVPLTFTLTINLFRPKLTSKQTSNPNHLSNELIIEGYIGEARRRKFLATSLSSLSGSFVGLAGYFIFKP